MNEITSFIDGSNIYGSSEEGAQYLRDIGGDLGLLRSGIVLNGKPLLPFHSSGDIDCQLDASTAHVPCFQAGDVRANEQLALTAMHTLGLREHNRVAEHLLKYNPHWQGDQVECLFILYSLEFFFHFRDGGNDGEEEKKIKGIQEWGCEVIFCCADICEHFPDRGCWDCIGGWGLRCFQED